MDDLSIPVLKRGAKWVPRVYKRKSSEAKAKDNRLATTAMVRSIVRRAVKRHIEDKQKSIEFGPLQIYQSIGAGDCYQLLPNLKQGADQETRVGNKVSPTKMLFSISINVYNQAVSYTPTYVDLYIFKYKGWSASLGTLPAPSMNQFLQAGSGSTSYTGITTDYLRPVNTDQFQLVYKRRLLMYNPLNTTTIQASTSSINPNRSFTIDLSKAVKKLLTFDDTQTDLPTNDQLWFCVGSTQTDGAIITTPVGRWSAISTLYYEDA